MSMVLHPIDSFTSLFLMYTGLPDCIGNSFQQHHKQHRQNTRQAFSQPLSDSFSYYIFSCPLVLSIISSNSFSKVCLLPKFCVLEKIGNMWGYPVLLFDYFPFGTLPKSKREGTPPPPFQILNFKMLQDVCNKQLLTPKTRPEPHFLTAFTMFYARTPFFIQKIATSKKTKKSLNN